MRIIDIFLAILITAIWGFNFVVVKVGLVDIAPIALCAARFFLSSVPAVFFIKPPKTPFRLLISYGLIMFALQFSLLFLSLAVGMSAGLASILLQTNVFFTALLAVLFLKEKLNVWQIMGILISFSGIGLVFANLGGNITFLGFILVISSALCWGAGNLISKKMGKINMLALVVWGSLIAWPPLVLIAIFNEGASTFISHFRHMSLLSLGAILFIVIPTTLIGFGVWNRLLKHYPVSMVAPFTLLVPFFGMMSGTLVLGEPLKEWEIIAGLLVVSGLFINLIFPRLFARSLRSTT